MYTRLVYSSTKFLFISFAEMQSSSADAVRSQSTCHPQDIFCLSFVYKILAMALDLLYMESTVTMQ